MLQENAQAAAGDGLQDSQNRLAGILRAANLGGSQVPVEMSLGGRMSGAKRTSRFRFSSAHRAADRQYLSQCEFRGFHTDIIRHREFERWSILLFGSSTDPKTGIYLSPGQPPRVLGYRRSEDENATFVAQWRCHHCAEFQSAPRPPILAGAADRTCNEAACWLITAAA